MGKIRRMKRHLMKNRIWYVTGIILLAAIMISMTLIPQKQKTEVQQPGPETFEIEENDIVGLDFQAGQITIKGVRLGDTVEQVIEKIGYPDSQASPAPSISNVEYSKRIGLDDTGLIIHFNNGIAKRITLRAPFNKYLIGNTTISHTKDEVYRLYGKPDEIKHIPVSQNSPIVYRSMLYKSKGLEVLLRGGNQIGLSFTFGDEYS